MSAIAGLSNILIEDYHISCTSCNEWPVHVTRYAKRSVWPAKFKFAQQPSEIQRGFVRYDDFLRDN